MSAETISITPPRQAPWLAGLHAAKANIVPGLIVQSVMLALFLAYKYYPPTTVALNHLANLKEAWGYGYSAIASIIAGGVIPELLRIGVFQRGKFLRRNFDNLAFSAPFWCFMGVAVDGFYRAQAVCFGADATLPVVITKVLMDQFVYNPLFAAPLTAVLYDWKNRGYGLHDFGGFFKLTYYRDVVVPTLFATWGVWVPVVSILYSLPSLLQIPLFALALSMWVTLYTWMSERRVDEK